MRAVALLLCLALPAPALADEVSDALSEALAAYEAGDLNTTSARMITAQKALQTQLTAKLAAFLPAAPEGWTLSQNTDTVDGMAMMGMAGVLIEGVYADAAGNSFTLTLTADSPLVLSMAGILGNPQMMAMMGKVTKVGGLDMLDQEGSLSALIANRVLVQAQGMDSAAMVPVLAAIDFDALATFDK
ncbi:hypothetical protein [Neotabrizicola sp. VNH66]|uniref:hypothetical protein n=1 Tax=Neotabrizicola sp. VNH66 TaxID=3400918 RepID=UPI003C0F1660